MINAVGLLHDETHGPEKSIRSIDPDFFIKNMNVNALPTLLAAQAFSKLLKSAERGIFATISAKVGSIEDNGLGGWHSYRCSKAALNMALKNIAIEWQRSHKTLCVASLHPGTTDTSLSKPFQKNVPDGKLFSAEKTASYIIDTLEKLTPTETGKFWSWDGTELPW